MFIENILSFVVKNFKESEQLNNNIDVNFDVERNHHLDIRPRIILTKSEKNKYLKDNDNKV